jgi:alkaline phosphatase
MKHKNMVIMRNILAFIIVISIFSTSCDQSRNTPGVEEKPVKAKNVILLIGDGMGFAQVYAGITASKDNLNVQQFPVTGIIKTFSLDDYITDSAAGGTALATGKKTANKVIGMDTTGAKYTSILEIAEKNGLATGLIATSSITHATPASFIAHQPSRYMAQEIAADFLNTDIELFIGGGKDHFITRDDGRDLLNELSEKGYEVIGDTTELKQTSAHKFAALLAAGHLPPAADGRGNFLSLATAKAIEALDKNDTGFFLMIEGSQIDWAGHDNNQEYLVSEMLDFDKAVGKALEFAKKDGETLVIVTADHETGGVTLLGGDIQKGEVNLAFSTDGHSGAMVPVFAYGPGAISFTGLYDNTGIFEKIIEAYRFRDN